MRPDFRLQFLMLLVAAALPGVYFLLEGDVQMVAIAAAVLACVGCCAALRRRSLLWRCAAGTLAFAASWEALLILTGSPERATAHTTLLHYGAGTAYVVGLLWCIWLVDRAGRSYEARRRAAGQLNSLDGSRGVVAVQRRSIWNPLDAAAWFYGRRSPKLNQSMVLLTAYSLLFVLASVASGYIHRQAESAELPAGGGGGGAGGPAQKMAVAQTVRLKKVVKKKFVINPFSAISFTPPPIDDVKLQLEQQTDHLYSAGSGQGGAGGGRGKGFGYGDGEGSGFGNGTGTGRVRFIRLQYDGGDWDQDFGVGADLNMLIEYGVRTGQKVNDRTESRTVSQLVAFQTDKSPPLVYLTGQRNINLSKADIKNLRTYLLDKHGMLFGDNGGSRHFHNQFFAMMRQVLPECEPVRVPLDDEIHRVPFPLPFLPYVAPHGGKDAWGWKVDGRWVCYYHPGDIGDAWSDGHSGVPRDVWDACYRLGANVIFYAHVEYAKWVMSRPKH